MGRPDFMLQENSRSYEPARIRKIERDPSKAKQEEMTREKNKKIFSKKQETPRTVFFLLGGKDVISLPCALEYL